MRQSHELIEISLSHCEVLDQAKIVVVVSLAHLKFKYELLAVIFGTKRLSNSVLTISKIDKVVASELNQ